MNTSGNNGNRNRNRGRGNKNTLKKNKSYSGLRLNEEDDPEVRLHKMMKFLHSFLKKYYSTEDTESYDLFASYLAVSVNSSLKDRADIDEFVRDVGRFEPSEPVEYLRSFYNYLKDTLQRIYKTGKDKLGRSVSGAKMSAYESFIDKLFLDFVEAREFVEGVVGGPEVVNAEMGSAAAAGHSLARCASGCAAPVLALRQLRVPQRRQPPLLPPVRHAQPAGSRAAGGGQRRAGAAPRDSRRGPQ